MFLAYETSATASIGSSNRFGSKHHPSGCFFKSNFMSRVAKKQENQVTSCFFASAMHGSASPLTGYPKKLTLGVTTIHFIMGT